MDFFKNSAVFIGWLASSLAGISAILYMCGYLVSQAQSNLLGVDMLLNPSPEQCIQEGGNFLAIISLELADIILNLLIVGVLAVGLIIIILFPLFLFISLYNFYKRRNFNEYWNYQRDRYFKLTKGHSKVWRYIIYFILILIFLFLVEDPHQFNDPLEINNLLYLKDDTVHTDYNKGVKAVKLMIMKEETKKLRDYFIGSMLIWLKSMLLLYLAWHITSTWHYRLFLVAPFAITTLITTILLPMLYGVLQKPIQFPVLTHLSVNNLSIDRTMKLYLLSKTNDAFVVWNAKKRQVIWIPTGEVKAAEIGQTEPLFIKSD